MHYSLSTEKVYLYWVKFFIRWHGRNGPMRHPRDMGAPEVEAFLTMLATERKVSTSTHNQALSALLFLYREALNMNLPWMDDINRPSSKRRIPSVLTRDEIAGVLAQLEGITAMLGRLLYGTGMRLMEGIRLRIKDVDFDRQVIIVREGKGNKDRVVMLPRSLAPAMRMQMLAARAIWEADRQAQRGGVETPHALEGIRTGQELLGHSDVSTTMIYTHVLKVAAGGTASPLDALQALAVHAPAPPRECRESHALYI